MEQNISTAPEITISNGLIEQGEFVFPVITTNFRVKARCRSIKFVNDGTAKAYVNGMPLYPNGGTQVTSASDGGILIQDFLITFAPTGTKEVYVAEVRDFGQATNF